MAYILYTILYITIYCIIREVEQGYRHLKAKIGWHKTSWCVTKRMWNTNILFRCLYGKMDVISRYLLCLNIKLLGKLYKTVLYWILNLCIGSAYTRISVRFQLIYYIFCCIITFFISILLMSFEFADKRNIFRICN